MTAKHLIYLQHSANSSNFLKQLLDGGRFDAVCCYDTNHLTDSLWCRPDETPVGQYRQLPTTMLKKDAITFNCNHSCLHVRGEETSSRRLEVFQFNSSSSLKVKVMTITNRLDELFRSRVILAQGDEEWWTVHQSCVCPVMINVLRLRFKMSERAVGWWCLWQVASYKMGGSGREE